VIQVILDNYRIQDRKITRAVLQTFGGRIRLHFLPPYCPTSNKLDRVWQDLHAHVRRNHTCPDMTSLMMEVRYYRRKRNRKASPRNRTACGSRRRTAA